MKDNILSIIIVMVVLSLVISFEGLIVSASQALYKKLSIYTHLLPILYHTIAIIAMLLAIIIKNFCFYWGKIIV